MWVPPYRHLLWSPSLSLANTHTFRAANSSVSLGEEKVWEQASGTCCTVEFPPLRTAIPSFRVDATIGPISPRIRQTWGYCIDAWCEICLLQQKVLDRSRHCKEINIGLKHKDAKIDELLLKPKHMGWVMSGHGPGPHWVVLVADGCFRLPHLAQLIRLCCWVRLHTFVHMAINSHRINQPPPHNAINSPT